MAKLFETDVEWRIEASRPGSVPYPGHWYVAGSRLIGQVKSPDGHELTQSLPFGLPSMQSSIMQGRVDPEGEASRMREAITRMLSADLDARAERLAAVSA